MFGASISETTMRPNPRPAGLGVADMKQARGGEKQIRGSGGSLEPPGPLPTHLRAVCTGYSECLPTLLNPLAERSSFSQARGLQAGDRTHGAVDLQPPDAETRPLLPGALGPEPVCL